MTFNEFSDSIEEALKAHSIDYTCFSVDAKRMILNKEHDFKRYLTYQVFVWKNDNCLYNIDGISPNEILIRLLGKILAPDPQLDIELP